MSHAPKEQKQKVPVYIVTFSDMITLLLTFFVLLLSMASKIEETKMERGRKAFINALSNFGLTGTAFSKKFSLKLNESGKIYKSDKNEESPVDQSIDMTEETVRRVFKQLEKLMKITPAQITGKTPEFMPTSIKFAKGKSALNRNAKRFIDNFCFNLKENISQSLTLYIVGFAPEVPGDAEQYMLSASRAQAVADYARKTLKENPDWKIHCWGAGPGGQWKTNGPAAEAEIIMATLGH